MRNASNPFGDRKSRTPATRNAPSVQDYRQRTKQQVRRPNVELCRIVVDGRRRAKEKVERAEREKFQSGRIGWKEGSPPNGRMHHTTPSLLGLQAKPNVSNRLALARKKLDPRRSRCPLSPTSSPQRANRSRVGSQKQLWNPAAND